MKRFFQSKEEAGFVRKIIAIFLILFSILSVLSRLSFDVNDVAEFVYPVNDPVSNLCGSIGSVFVFKTIYHFGEAFWLFPSLSLYYCYRMYFKIETRYALMAFGLVIALPTLSFAIYLITKSVPAWSSSYGGIFATYFGDLIFLSVGLGGCIVVLIIGLILLMYLFEMRSWFSYLLSCEPIVVDTKTDPDTPVAEVVERPSKSKNIFTPPAQEEVDRKVEKVKTKEPKEEEPIKIAPAPQIKTHVSKPVIAVEEESLHHDEPPLEENVPIQPKQKDGDFILPTLALLDLPIATAVDSDELLKQRGVQLEEMFKNFKIGCHVIGMERGPSITQFELSLDDGIRVNKVTGLSDNIALTLKAPSVRVVAPIPGRSTIGIEIPNLKKEMVNMRSIMETDESKAIAQAMHIPLVLGKDVAGAPLISDLAKMPHLLVAGTTGSGKSVCINTIIISVMYYNLPTQVKLIMIDPKMVEMSGYGGIPHLMRPVITDMNEAAGVLDWACRRMDERYTLLTRFRVRDIATFNKLPKAKILETLGDEGSIDDIEWPMPYIVIIVDEFSDLMMVGAKEIETYITRLAQKSRAVGIHVILATQRPSVDVITGLIKTNMPSRIAFQVAAKIDSRTILDQNGADKLLGKGDLLFLPPGTSSLTRAQGALVGDEEIEKMVEFWKEQGDPVYVNINEVARSQSSKRSRGGTSSLVVPDEELNGDEEIYQEAVKVVLENGRASASFIQRQLKIGYNKASRLIELMEERNVVSPSKGSNKRDLMISYEDWQKQNSGESAAESETENESEEEAQT